MIDPACTIIIPAYNESRLIAQTVRAIQDGCGTSRPWQIIVVDDGSSDGTADAAQSAMGDGDTVIRRPKCAGKATAIAAGVDACKTDRLMFTDADLSVSAVFFEPFAKELDDHPVVIASRRMAGSVLVRRQPPLREACGEIFRRMVRFAFMPDISDFTCGLKAFRTADAQRLFRDLRCRDWTFDVEVLLRARRDGLAIREIPVRWSNRADSRVRIVSAAARSLVSLARLWAAYR